MNEPGSFMNSPELAGMNEPRPFIAHTRTGGSLMDRIEIGVDCTRDSRDPREQRTQTAQDP